MADVYLLRTIGSQLRPHGLHIRATRATAARNLSVFDVSVGEHLHDCIILSVRHDDSFLSQQRHRTRPFKQIVRNIEIYHTACSPNGHHLRNGYITTRSVITVTVEHIPICAERHFVALTYDGVILKGGDTSVARLYGKQGREHITRIDETTAHTVCGVLALLGCITDDVRLCKELGKVSHVFSLL